MSPYFEKDRKIDEEENDIGKDQDDDFEYNLADDEQVDENNVDAKLWAGPPAGGGNLEGDICERRTLNCINRLYQQSLTPYPPLRLSSAGLLLQGSLRRFIVFTPSMGPTIMWDKRSDRSSHLLIRRCQFVLLYASYAWTYL